MGRKQWMQGLAAALGFLVLIFDSRTAVEGARNGIDICLRTVIPSLFPFFVLSIAITKFLSGQTLSFFRRITGVLGIPQAGASVLVPAFLGGYPVGAQSVGMLYHTEKISKKDAERMLAFCNNAGPSFLFGMTAAFFPEPWMAAVLWVIHIFGALMTAVVLFEKESHNANSFFPGTQSAGNEILMVAAKAMLSVCSWVILFRTLIAFLKKWFFWRLSIPVQVLITGCLELANGCCELACISDVQMRFVVCSCMLAFGGISVYAQTASVTKGLSLHLFFCGKMIQTLFCFLMSCAVISDHGIIYAAAVPVFLVILRKLQKRYSIPGAIPV